MNQHLLQLFISLSLLISASRAASLDCKKNSILQKYKLSQVNSVDELPVYHKSKILPPSKVEESWFLNICSVQDNKKNKDRLSTCDENSVVCGNQKITLNEKDDKNPTVSEIFNIAESVAPSDIYTVGSGDEGDGSGISVGVSYKNIEWGSQSVDVGIKWQCDENMKNDVIKSVVVSEIPDTNIMQYDIVLNGPSGCPIDKNDKNDGKNGDDNNNNGDDNNDNKDEDKPNDSPKTKKHTSWFSFLVMYALLFTLIYLVASSYLAVRARNGNLMDFRIEFIGRLVTLIKACPALLKELFEKILGRNRGSASDLSSSRGGYSAV
ncbi:hypothetical protein ACO0QE_002149 [Hanseniaspora vineae]